MAYCLYGDIMQNMLHAVCCLRFMEDQNWEILCCFNPIKGGGTLIHKQLDNAEGIICGKLI